MTYQENKNRDLFDRFFKNFSLFLSQIGHYYAYGGYFAMYLWFVLFNILALHQIIINLFITFLTIIIDSFIYISIKKRYYDTYNFGSNLILLTIFFMFETSYFLKAWFGIPSDTLIIGYLIGYSQLKAPGIMATLIKSIGSVALIIAIISIINYSKTGYYKIIPGWNDYVHVSENFILTYIISTLHVLGSLMLASYIENKIAQQVILLSFFVLASFLLVPIYIVKIKKLAIYSPETKKVLEKIGNLRKILFLGIFSTILGSICLILESILGGGWAIGGLLLNLFTLFSNRYLFVGSIVKEEREDQIEDISIKLFGIK